MIKLFHPLDIHRINVIRLIPQKKGKPETKPKALQRIQKPLQGRFSQKRLRALLCAVKQGRTTVRLQLQPRPQEITILRPDNGRKNFLITQLFPEAMQLDAALFQGNFIGPQTPLNKCRRSLVRASVNQ